MAFPTQNIETMNSGMMNNSGYLTNDIREMRLQNMYTRYGMGGNQAQFDPNQTYATIPGMTDEDSQNVGKIASAIGTPGNTSYMPPVNQFAQILLNNKPLLGAASNFAEGFAKALQTPPPMSEQEKLKEQYLQSEIYKNLKTNSGGQEIPKNLETTFNAYFNNDTTKGASRVAQMYGAVKNLYGKVAPTPQDDAAIVDYAARIMSPMSRTTDIPPDPNTGLNFLTSLGIAQAQAEKIQAGTKTMSPEERRAAVNRITAIATGIQDAANTARGAYTRYAQMQGGLEQKDIDTLFPAFAVKPIEADSIYAAQTAGNKPQTSTPQPGDSKINLHGDKLTYTANGWVLAQ